MPACVRAGGQSLEAVVAVPSGDFKRDAIRPHPHAGSRKMAQNAVQAEVRAVRGDGCSLSVNGSVLLGSPPVSATAGKSRSEDDRSQSVAQLSIG